ncbi:hypothetical protein SNEBB_004501 [Seison nebaliae]|nr:hypothetical protein SNEBB_004501 [Seison nebaliae]
MYANPIPTDHLAELNKKFMSIPSRFRKLKRRSEDHYMLNEINSLFEMLVNRPYAYEQHEELLSDYVVNGIYEKCSFIYVHYIPWNGYPWTNEDMKLAFSKASQFGEIESQEELLKSLMNMKVSDICSIDVAEVLFKCRYKNLLSIMADMFSNECNVKYFDALVLCVHCGLPAYQRFIFITTILLIRSLIVQQLGMAYGRWEKLTAVFGNWNIYETNEPIVFIPEYILGKTYGDTLSEKMEMNHM